MRKKFNYKLTSQHKVLLIKPAQIVSLILIQLLGDQGYTATTEVTVVYKINSDHITTTVPTITPQLREIRSWNGKAYFFSLD